jgi:hypothetical protein
VKIGKLIRDRALLPKLPKNASVVDEAGRAARADFLLRRARRALVANPSWKGSDPDEVKDANAPALKTLLAGEVSAAATKVATLRTAMSDTTKTELLGIDDASIDPPRAAAGKKPRFVERYDKTPKQLRGMAIVAGGWMTLAENPSITDADLHTLVSRRLMVTERMLWYIGKPGRERPWKLSGSKWSGGDGWKRMFEYPRLPREEPFDSTCAATGSNTVCDLTGNMAGWFKGAQYVHRFQIGAAAATNWTPHPSDQYVFFFDKSSSNNPADAVTKLFTAEEDLRRRNLLMCDQVIQCLHLESLLRVKSKRDGNSTWFGTLVNAEANGWLRVTNPWRPVPVFLVGKQEPRFFEVKKIQVPELQVGDHVIVFNHPAYDMAKDPDDVWRLENALVVSVSPRLLLQGHGTNPLPFTSTREKPVRSGGKKLEPSMRLNMLGLFNTKLKQLMDVAKAENLKTNPRTTISGLGSDAVLVQRTVPGPHSGYDPNGFSATATVLARWWIQWDLDPGKDEATIEADSQWAKWVWTHQLVELVGTKGYFPLWLPSLKRNGQPHRDSAGKIKLVKRVFVRQRMAPGWDWYYLKNEPPDDTARHRVSARRPKVS